MASLEVNLNLPPGGTPSGQPGQAGGTPGQGGGAGAGAGALDLSRRQASPDWDVNDPMQTGPARAAREAYAKAQEKYDWDAEYKKVYESLDKAADVAKRQAREEAEAHDRRMAVMRERFEVESAATVAARQWEEESALRQRSLDVQREKHDLEGAAAEEARLRLEAQREGREWEQKVNQERRRQDPGAATAEDLGALGGLLSQAGMGTLGRVLQMAPKLQQELGLFGEPGGKKEGGGGGALEKATEAAKQGEGRGGGAAGKAAKAAKQLGGGEGAGEGAGEAASGAEGALGGAAEGAEAVGLFGAGGLAAAAGPAGAIVAAAYEVADTIAQAWVQAINDAKQAMRDFAAGVSGFVKGDYLGAASDGLEQLSLQVGRFGLAWQPVSAAGQLAAEALRQVAVVQNAFLEVGQKIGPFSAAITQAQAMAEVRGIFGDIRESERLGNSISRLIDAQSRTSDDLRELSGPLKKIAAEGVTIPQEVVASFTDKLRAIVEKNVGMDKLNDAVDRMTAQLRAALGLGKDEDMTTLTQIAAAFGWDTGVNLVDGMPRGEVPRDPARGGF